MEKNMNMTENEWDIGTVKTNVGYIVSPVTQGIAGMSKNDVNLSVGVYEKYPSEDVLESTFLGIAPVSTPLKRTLTTRRGRGYRRGK